MKEFEIEITETLQKTVKIRAESREEAEAIAQEKWNRCEIVLDSENFIEADFSTISEKEIKPKRKDEMER
ncbi:DpnD/PcfM family protein [Faecalibacterium prausnitzii]|jgi:hypothetical protein|uniref:DpnD/PcfM family protein n=1 Tax=Faecalibacterium prausnitzii TaxID=853 RepID=UPI000E40C854|nr:DpnD/PcfM family protein [Faecalibacterium prausnitzii]RGC40962.1 protein DpnD [Faecalibacterium prausnitzii]